MSDCREALRLEPELAWARSTLAEALGALGLDAASAYAEAPAVADAAGTAAVVEDAAAAPADPVRTEPPLSHRERGNALFKAGRLRKATEAYQRACDEQEDGWVLALSNLAICHLRLEDHEEAVAAADRCLAEEGAPPKAALTKFKALAAQQQWRAAFACLRGLRAGWEALEPAVRAAALQEERAKRQARREQSGAAAEAPAAAAEGGRSRDPQRGRLLGESLPRTVRTALPCDAEPARTIDIVGTADAFPFAFSCLPELVAEECTIRVIGPALQRPHQTEETKVLNGRTIRVVYLCQVYAEAVPAAEYAPDLAVLGCPDLSGALDDWAPVLRHLVRLGVLTVVTGTDRDQSLVQNEDLLLELGCKIVCPTTISSHAFASQGACRNHHVLAFRGGAWTQCGPTGGESDDLSGLKSRLGERGFSFAG